MNFRRSRVLAPVEFCQARTPEKPNLCRCRQRCAGRKLGSAAKKISRRIAICFGGRSRLCLKGAVKVGDDELSAGSADAAAERLLQAAPAAQSRAAHKRPFE